MTIDYNAIRARETFENSATVRRIRAAIRPVARECARFEVTTDELCDRMNDLPTFGPSLIRRRFLR